MQGKTRKILEWVIFSFLGLLIVVCGSLFFYQVTYANKIYKNVYVAGIDMSGKSKSQAAALINKKFDDILNDEITLKAQNKELKTKVSDTGLTLDVNKIVTEAYGAGRSTNFFEQLKSSAKTLKLRKDVVVEAKIDQEKYNNFLKIAVAQFNSDPADASLKIDNGQIVELAEKEGLVVDTSTLPEKILSLGDEQTQKIIDLDIKKTAPGIKLSDFGAAKTNAEIMLSKKIEFSYENKTYTPSRVEIGNWIAFSNRSGNVEALINDSNVQAYLNKIARDFEVIKKDKKVNGNDGSVIEEGQEGKLLDKNAAIKQIKDQIKSSGESKIALSINVVPPSEVRVFPALGAVPGRFDGKYIDIDLTTQKLCRIEGANVLDCTLISSGKPGMDTPTGTYTISEKHPRHWSNKYKMWLPYWERFIDEGYGLHELPETSNWKETPEHLGTPVSHGCVRLGVGPAQSVYDWTEIGTPIFIHK